MKKKLISLLLVSAMVVSLTACGEVGDVAGDIESAREAVQEISNEFSTEDIAEGTEEVAEEPSNEESIMNLFNAIYSGYKEFIDEGYDEENNAFTSPVTDVHYLNPKFALCDANGDNYDDLVIWGELGLRNKQMCEVYFYVEDGDAFFGIPFDGYVEALSEGCILVKDVDREVDSEKYYETNSVYKLDPAGPTLILSHSNTDDNGNVTDEYLAGDKEITEEEYKDQFAKYEAAIIPLECYVEMTPDNIADEFNML